MTAPSPWTECTYTGRVVNLTADTDPASRASHVTLDLGERHLIELVLPADHEPPALHETLQLVLRRSAP